MVHRKIIACCRDHGTFHEEADFMYGYEILVAQGRTKEDAESELSNLAHMYGWKKIDGQWECGIHRDRPNKSAEYVLCKHPIGKEVAP